MPMKYRRENDDFSHVAVCGPNGHYWITMAFYMLEGASSVRWAILAPGGNVWRSGDARYGTEADRDEVCEKTAEKCREKLKRYFAKWTSHHGIPIPP